MGKKSKSKKIKGAAKAKTKVHKQVEKAIKKEVPSDEKSFEEIISEFQEEQRRRTEVTVVEAQPPSPRVHFSIVAVPDTNELLIFGGEFFDGRKIFVYADLFSYQYKINIWQLVKSPNTPPPRSGHQTVLVNMPSTPASLYLFGGEYSNPSQTKFYHYRDLWRFCTRKRKWEFICDKSGPSARSGHRMIFWKSSLLLFGGFNDTGSKTTYLGDLWKFDLVDQNWTALAIIGDNISPRSACLLFPGLDLRHMYLIGGYSKRYSPQGIEKGVSHPESYLLAVRDKTDSSSDDVLTFRTSSQRICGSSPRPWLNAMSGVLWSKNRALVFGGLHDIEDESGEVIHGYFHNDLFIVELEKAKWNVFRYECKDDPAEVGQLKQAKKPRLINPEAISPFSEADSKASSSSSSIMEQDLSLLHIANASSVTQTPSLDNGFSLTINTQASKTEACKTASNSFVISKAAIILPPPRSSAGIALIGSHLFVYGGIFEIGDRRITLDDFYCLDLSKPTGWQCLYPGTAETQDWLGSDSENDSNENDGPSQTGDPNSSSESDDDDDDDDDDDEELDIDAPLPLRNETFEDYWLRSKSIWTTAISQSSHQSTTEALNARGGESEDQDHLAISLALDFFKGHK